MTDEEETRLTAELAKLRQQRRNLDLETGKIKRKLDGMQRHRRRAIVFQKRVQTNKRNREIYAMREKGLTLRAVGEHFGMGAEQVRQVVKRVMRDLSKYGSITPEQQVECELTEKEERWKECKEFKEAAEG